MDLEERKRRVEELMRWFSENVDIFSDDESYEEREEELLEKLREVLDDVVFAPLVMLKEGFVFDVGSFSEQGKVFDVFAIFTPRNRRLFFEKVEIEERGKPSLFTSFISAELRARLLKAFEDIDEMIAEAE
ncbi:MAG: hypothetical protein QXS63_05550 [Zestosphaera sp.]